EDILDMPHRPDAALDLRALDGVLRSSELMPNAVTVRGLGTREYGYLAPGMEAEVRVTTDPQFYEEHADSLELWSPGCPVFPGPAGLSGQEASSAEDAIQG